MTGVDFSFPDSFEIDRERLLGIDNLLRDRLKRHSQPVFYRYRTIFDDDFHIEDSQIDKVLNEEETSWRTIIGVTITAKDESGFSFALDFSRTGTTLNIKGEDNDEVSLLDQAIRKFLKLHVNKFRDFSSSGNQPLAYFIAVIGLILLSMWGMNKSIKFNFVSSDEVNSVVSSNNIEAKLNYLIRKSGTPSIVFAPLFYVWFLMLIATVLLFWWPYFGVLNYFFPRNVMLLGIRKQQVEKRQKLFWNIFWSVLISFALSILSILVAPYITNSKP